MIPDLPLLSRRLAAALPILLLLLATPLARGAAEGPAATDREPGRAEPPESLESQIDRGAAEDAGAAHPATAPEVRTETPLPVEARYAMPLVDTTLQLAPPLYGQAKPAACVVSFALPKDAEAYPWDLDALGDDTAFRVVWIHGDRQVKGVELDRADLASDPYLRYPHQFRVLRGAASGRALLFAVDPDSGPVERARPMRTYERAAFFFDPERLGPLDKREAKDPDGFRAAHYAAASGNLAALEALAEARWSRFKDEGPGNLTPVLLAVANGRAEALDKLLDATRFAKSQLRASSAATGPMDYAAFYGHLDCLERLRQEADGYGDLEALAEVAIEQSQFAVAKRLFEEAGDEVPLRDYSRKEAAVMRLFASRRADFALFLCEQWNLGEPLVHEGLNRFHAVAYYADPPLLERVSRLGDDIDLFSPEGLSPLNIAVAKENIPAVCWFLDNGATRQYEDPAKYPLRHAIALGAEESVACLLDYGFDANLPDNLDATPIMQAALLQQAEILQMLRRAGGAWNPQSPISEFALAKAIAADIPEALEAAYEGGLPRDRRLFGEIPARWLARFHQAEKVLARLDDAAEPGAAPYEMPSAGEADSRPRLRGAQRFEYPKTLDDRYGELNLTVEAVISSDGQVAAHKLEGDVPEPVAAFASKWIDTFVFESARFDRQPRAVRMKFKLPLKRPEEKVYEFKELDEPPKPLSQTKPNYPTELFQKGVSGNLILEFVIHPDGRVSHFRVIETSHVAFNQPAIESIKQSTWSPGIKNGQPVPVRVTQEIRFNP